MGSPAGYPPPTVIYTFNVELGRAEMVALQDINGDGTADMVFDRVTGNRHCFFARAYRNGAFEAQSNRSRCAYVERPSDWEVVLAAGPAVRDAVNETGKVFEMGLNDAVFIAVEGSAVAAVVFEDIGGPVGDVVDGIESALIGAVDAVGGGVVSIGQTVGGGIGSAVNVIGSIF